MHMQNEELQALKAAVLEQQGKALVPFQLDAVKYVDWDPDQREAYLQRLHHTLQILQRWPAIITSASCFLTQKLSHV